MNNPMETDLSDEGVLALYAFNKIIEDMMYKVEDPEADCLWTFEEANAFIDMLILMVKDPTKPLRSRQEADLMFPDNPPQAH